MADFTPLLAARDAFAAFKLTECPAMVEALIRQRFSPVDSAGCPSDSVSGFMRQRHSRSRKGWAPLWADGARRENHAALLDAARGMQAAGNTLWRGYLLQMSDMFTVNFLAEGTVFEVDLHVAFESLLPDAWPSTPDEIAVLLEAMYRPKHPVRQILFSSDSHYLFRILQGKP